MGGGKRGKGARSNQMRLCPAFGNDKLEQLCMKAVTLAVASPVLLICSKANMLYNSVQHT